MCVIGAVSLIHSLYRRVRAYLQQPVTHPSSRQTVPLACVRVKLLQVSQTAAVNRGGGGVGRWKRWGGGGRGHLQRLVSTLSRFSAQNGTMFTFGNVTRKRNDSKGAEDTSEESRLSHGKDT